MIDSELNPAAGSLSRSSLLSALRSPLSALWPESSGERNQFLVEAIFQSQSCFVSGTNSTADSVA